MPTYFSEIDTGRQKGKKMIFIFLVKTVAGHLHSAGVWIKLIRKEMPSENDWGLKIISVFGMVKIEADKWIKFSKFATKICDTKSAQL